MGHLGQHPCQHESQHVSERTYDNAVQERIRHRVLQKHRIACKQIDVIPETDEFREFNRIKVSK
ncbi:hypothetical protein D3C72_2270780 [compost metagenome]